MDHQQGKPSEIRVGAGLEESRLNQDFLAAFLFEAGFDDLLIKPINLKAVESVLADCLKS